MRIVRRLLLPLLSLPLFVLPVSGQSTCRLEVDAGADRTLCSPTAITLNAVPTESVFQVQWSSSDLSIPDPNSLSTTVDIDRSGTLIVEVKSLSDVNLILNGDFSLGDTGFTTEYEEGTDPGGLGLLKTENHYAIADDPRDTHRRFASCNDHTSGDGNMMIANGSGRPNDLWCQTVTVEARTEYRLAVWVASMVSENPAILQFFIDGEAVGDALTASSTPCNWTELTSEWLSGSETTVEICLVNVNDSPAGNDFAIDDISLREICIAGDTVSVDLVEARAEWTAPPGLCTNEDEIDPAVFLSPDADTGGIWMLSGEPVVTIRPGELGPGEYPLTYIVEKNGCRDENTQTLTVLESPDAGDPLPPPDICNGREEPVDLFALLEGESPGGRWREAPGNPTLFESLDPVRGIFDPTGQPFGTYAFIYQLDAPSTCPDAESTVQINLLQSPVADAGQDRVLDCLNRTVDLGGPNTSLGGQISYFWSTPAGDTIPDSDIPFIEVDEAGIYILKVSRMDNVCLATDTVEVTVDRPSILATLSVESVSCFGSSDGSISVESVSGGEPPYEYSLNAGPFSTTNKFGSLPPG
ncbi:MAG: hypothetical protein R3350_03955, partial [Saprospiraceae bacterium]|nr:hypothetical protein [Saprospiraceae bacterium]